MKGQATFESALRCYPAWWRKRYGNEVSTITSDLKAEGRSTAALTFDLLRGALQVRSHAPGMPKTYELWSARTRVSITTATLSWLLISPLVLVTMGDPTLHSSTGLVSGNGFDFFPTHLVMDATFAPAPPLTPAGSIVTYANLAVLSLFLATLVVLSSGWRELRGGIRRSATPHRGRLILLAWVPAVSVLADISLAFAQNAVGPNSFRETAHGTSVPLNGNLAAAHTLGITLDVVAIVGWLLSIGCVAYAARRAEIAPFDLRYGRTVSVIVATLFALMLAAYLAWGIGLILQARQSAGGHFTTMTFPHQDLWLPIVALLLIAVAVSAYCARKAMSSWKVISSKVL